MGWYRKNEGTTLMILPLTTAIRGHLLHFIFVTETVIFVVAVGIISKIIGDVFECFTPIIDNGTFLHISTNKITLVYQLILNALRKIDLLQR